MPIVIVNRQKCLPVERRRIRRAVRTVFDDAGIAAAEIGIAVVDDRTIAAAHEMFLGDPDPTDVISFILSEKGEPLVGEIMISAETALANSARWRTSPADELLLYAIHGALHLVGHDDRTARQRVAMKKLQRRYLRQFRGM
jgi:probable rRNA maturation factor